MIAIIGSPHSLSHKIQFSIKNNKEVTLKISHVQKEIKLSFHLLTRYFVILR